MRRTAEYELIAEVGQALEFDLSEIGHKVVKLIDSEVWRDFTDPMGRRNTFGSFAEFVETPPVRGLGTTLARLRQVCADYEPAMERLRDEVPVAAPPRSPVRNTNSKHTDTEDTVIARLKRDDPDLASQVIRGEKSANAAAIEAGFRPKRFTVRTDRIDLAAAAIKKHLTPAQVDELKEAL